MSLPNFQGGNNHYFNQEYEHVSHFAFFHDHQHFVLFKIWKGDLLHNIIYIPDWTVTTLTHSENLLQPRELLAFFFVVVAVSRVPTSS